MVKIVHYVSHEGKDYFDQWFRVQDLQARSRVQVRLNRVRLGNFGDHKSVGGGVSELRIDFGPRYRVYFGRDGEDLVILLGGGTKRRQTADIERAQALWQQYREEKRDARRRT